MNGERGASGERGDSGNRGVAGERGPKGDRGQEGHDGGQGKQGERGHTGAPGVDALPPITRRLAIILTVLLTVAWMGSTWKGERDSCTRQDGVREASRIFADTAYTARTAAAKKARREGDMAQFKIDDDAARAYQRSRNVALPLNCGGLFPDTR